VPGGSTAAWHAGLASHPAWPCPPESARPARAIAPPRAAHHRGVPGSAHEQAATHAPNRAQPARPGPAPGITGAVPAERRRDATSNCLLSTAAGHVGIPRAAHAPCLRHRPPIRRQAPRATIRGQSGSKPCRARSLGSSIVRSLRMPAGYSFGAGQRACGGARRRPALQQMGGGFGPPPICVSTP